MKKTNKNYSIIVRLEYSTYQQWLFICEVLKGTTRSDVFRKIIKRLHSSIEEITNIQNYG